MVLVKSPGGTLIAPGGAALAATSLLLEGGMECASSTLSVIGPLSLMQCANKTFFSQTTNYGQLKCSGPAFANATVTALLRDSPGPLPPLLTAPSLRTDGLIAQIVTDAHHCSSLGESPPTATVSCGAVDGNRALYLTREACFTSSSGCPPGLTGPDCLAPACPNACYDRGTCVASAVGAAMCNCSNGWTGSDCSVPTCPGGCTGNHGRCVEAFAPVCVCNAGWTGVDCAIPVCACGPNQYCEALSNPPTCKCIAGWSGANCSDAAPNQLCPGNCSGRGICNASLAQCECNNAQGGLDCSVPLCDKNCNNHGLCLPDHTCACDVGFLGANCSIAACPASCGHGRCLQTASAAVCVCEPGWFGGECSLAAIDADNARTVAPENDGKPGKWQLTTKQIELIVLGSIVALLIGAFYVVRWWRRREEALLLGEEPDSQPLEPVHVD